MGSIFLLVFFVLSLLAGMFFKSKSKEHKELKIGMLISFVLAALFALLLVFNSIQVIGAGHVGVIDTFGNVSDNTLKPGINIINPMSHVEEMTVKTQELKETMNVPSKEGLNVGLDVSVLYHLDPNKANEIYKTVGPEWVEVILKPQFRSVVRGVTSRFEAKTLYSQGREQLDDLILVELKEAVGKRGVYVETTPLRDLNLPTQLANAIEHKLKIEQESEQMQFTLKKEQQEADRKRIEAQGISDFQKIVSQGISQQLLEWKGIEATEKLAMSHNAKMVIIGGKDGLPLILNGQ